MKKFLGMLLVVAMVLSLVACGKKSAASGESGQTATQQAGNTNNTAIGDSTGVSGEGKETDEKKLGESVSYQRDGEGNIVFSIKTSAEIK